MVLVLRASVSPGADTERATRACACVCARVRVCVWVCVGVGVCACVCLFGLLGAGPQITTRCDATEEPALSS
eukprot:COSAG01_NODE_9177_length_2529_cov_1.462551_2_plen_72_part_00